MWYCMESRNQREAGKESSRVPEELKAVVCLGAAGLPAAEAVCFHHATRQPMGTVRSLKISSWAQLPNIFNQKVFSLGPFPSCSVS